MNKREFGKAGELLAAGYLKQMGYRILCTNYWCSRGEIDIIAQKGNCVHFVEVKTRAGEDYGRASECISPQKLRRMQDAANSYMKSVCGMPGLAENMQFDLIEIRMEHLQNI